MNLHRVKEIVDSNQNYIVTLEGDPVWIDEYDDTTNLITVHSEESGRVTKVSVERLHEQ